MLRLLSDENFRGAIVRGLKLRDPNVDIQRVQDVGLRGLGDEQILAWAAENNRIVLTHDQATFGRFAYARVDDGKSMPGVFVVSEKLPVSEVINAILLLTECSEQADWDGLVTYLPL